MPEGGQHGWMWVTRQRMRPPPIKNGWMVIVIAVSLVIFMAVTLWFTGGSGSPDGERISDREVIHQLSTRLQARWPQVPGPPAVYVQQARQSYQQGDSLRALQRRTMALALSPNDIDGWLWMVILSSEVGAPEGLDPDESAAVILEVGKIEPNHPLMGVAMGWLAHRQSDTKRALSSVGTQPRTLPGRWLRLRVLGPEAVLADGQAVLELAPAHGGACRWTAKRALDSGRSAVASDVLARCVAAGADVETAGMWRQVQSMGETSPTENGPKTLDSSALAP